MSSIPLQQIDDLTLRPVDGTMAPALFAVVDTNREHLRRWLPWVDGTRTQTDSEAFLRASEEEQQHHTGCTMSIWRGEQLLGLIGLHHVVPGATIGEIGYWLAAHATGAGVMTRACRAMVSIAFRDFPIDAIKIRCATGNCASRAIPERLGFTLLEDVRHTEELYGEPIELLEYRMAREQWEQLHY